MEQSSDGLKPPRGVFRWMRKHPIITALILLVVLLVATGVVIDRVAENRLRHQIGS